MIDIKLKINLGNFPQKIHLKSDDLNKPILLFLHGGPGITNRHFVMLENDDLLSSFTIVAWDQRGTAGSYKGSKKETFTISQLVEDAHELVEYLCRTYHKDKIFVIGGSWGSLLGVELLAKYPEHIYALVGFGQFVNGGKNELLSYQFVLDEANKAHDIKAINTLKRIGPPVDGMYVGGFKGMMKQRHLMMKYGGYSSQKGKQSYWDAVVKPVLFSGEYSFSDIVGYLKGYRPVLETMWPEIGKVDFMKTHTEFKAPIFIFDGKLDQNTPSELVEDYFKTIKAPHKELIWFEQSGHNPLSDEPEKFKKLLKEKLLPLNK